MNFIRLVPVVLVLFVLGACGGGGGSSRVPDLPPPTPTVHDVDLGDLMLEDGTEAGSHNIAAGASIDIGGITFTCPAGNDCTLMINDEGEVTSTGGMVTAMATPPPPPVVHAVTLPDEPMVPEGVAYTVPETSITEPVTIDAGDMQTIGYVTFSCPAGGDACTIAQADDGSITSTGGMATVMVAESVTTALQAAIDAKAEEDRLAALRVQEHAVDLTGLLEGYTDIPAGTLTLAPGEMMDVGHATFSCSSANEVNCVITVADDGSAMSMGGEATATPSQMALDDKERDDEATREAAAAAAETAARIVAGYIDKNSERADLNTETDGILAPVTVEDNTPPDVGTLDVTDEMPVFDGDSTTTDMTDDFVKSTDAVASLGMRWSGGKYTRTMDGVTDTIVKYADKAANKDSNFGAYFDVIRAGTTGAHAAGVLTLDSSSDDAQADNHGLFSIDFGIDGRNQDNPIEHATGETSTEFTGMFTGVPGTFSCTGTCLVHSDDMGRLNGLSGTWTFTPDGIEGITENDERNTVLAGIPVPDVLPDADYMIFGYWLRETTDEDGMVTRAFSAFTDGNQPYGAIAGTVAGTATYSGPATGMYMKKSLTPDGQPTRPFSSGQFTADALLTANFGGTGVAQDNHFSIAGTISNFMDGGEVINDLWVVNLKRPADDTSTAGTDESKNIDVSNGTFQGVTDGGMLGSDTGAFSGMFHGPSANSAQPSSASGIFDGHFSNGHVRGAFGTHKQAE